MPDKSDNNNNNNKCDNGNCAFKCKWNVEPFKVYTKQSLFKASHISSCANVCKTKDRLEKSDALDHISDIYVNIEDCQGGSNSHS